MPVPTQESSYKTVMYWGYRNFPVSAIVVFFVCFLSLFLYLYNKVELNPFRVNADDDKSKLILLCHSLIEISIHFVKTLWYQNSLCYANQRGPIGIHLFLQKLQ